MRLRKKSGIFAFVSAVAALAAWVLVSGGGSRSELAASQPQRLRPTGSPQLVSVEPLPETDGPMCAWESPNNSTSPKTGKLVPASASTSMVAELARERMAAAPAGSADAGRTPIAVDRAPERVIRDPYPNFSSVAVEPKSGMLVVTDENLFQILQYNRTDNTPPTAKMTEPKRVIGGPLTKAEMICDAYIDPKTLDTYVVNNDTQDWLSIFSKTARGNVAPNRVLAVPHGTFGIAVDEARKELYLTVEHNDEVVVYPKMASGHEPPLREIIGDATHLQDPHGIALDSKDDLLFVSNHGNVRLRGKHWTSPRRYIRGSGRFDPPSITVYRRDARGDAAPLRIIAGSKTGLNWPMQIAVDPKRGELYVANDMGQSIEIFKITDNGNVAPSRIIKGSKTHIKNPTGVALDLQHQEVWVSNMGDHAATVYPLSANGNVPPRRIIRGGPANELSLMIGNPGAVGYDSKRQQILVPN